MAHLNRWAKEMSASSQAYRSELRSVLEKARAHLVSRLQEFVSSDIPLDVVRVIFEDCGDPHGSAFPVYVALTTAQNDVYCDSRRVFLRTIPFRLPSHLNPAASDCGVADASEEWEEVFYPWFRDCWLDAGGLHFRVPAFIGERDSADAVDLRSGDRSKLAP